jgi:hypothetical protein
MARASEDPSSPVDAYASPAPPVPLGDPAAPQNYAAAAQHPSAPAATSELNVLAVIAFIASCIGFSIPGLVMGHIALSQIKKNGESGHGFALAAVIIGYAVTVLVVLAVVAFVIFLIVVLTVTNSAVDTFGNFG